MITASDFKLLQDLLLKRSGMSLTSDKLYLVAGRLAPVAQKFGLRGVLDLVTYLRGAPGEDLVTAVVEAMATHESLFFRDQKPFEHLASTIIPELLSRRGGAKKLRFWSAACSTGQEPYSLAMMLTEIQSQSPGSSFEIVASDFVPAVLEKARAGIYTKFEIDRGVSAERLVRHFDAAGGNWRVKDRSRSLIQFKSHNLLDGAAHLGMFDVILCRNVLIYFDAPTKDRVLANILKQMQPHGCAIFGSADVTVGTRADLTVMNGLTGAYRFSGVQTANVA